MFERNTDLYKHVVYHQPTLDNSDELQAARAALAACPVAAIRVENNVHGEDGRELKEALSIQNEQPFPQPIYPLKSDAGEAVDIGVHYLGHHNDASFGAIPYLIHCKSPKGGNISVIVDVPRFSPSAVRAVNSLTRSGPDYMFLTHVDDTADHNKWKKEFPALKRIFHSGDLGRYNWVGDLTLEDVEILLHEKDEDMPEGELIVWDIDGNRQSMSRLEHMEHEDVLILHTPGHSPGSISLLFRSPHMQGREILSPDGKKSKYPGGILFTGDTYAYTTRDGGHMSGFPRYGNNLLVQCATLQKLSNIRHSWDIVAPGHGHPRFYLDYDVVGSVNTDEIKLNELNDALEELLSY